MSRDMSLLHPELQNKFAQLVSLCKAQGLIIKNTDTLRNAAEQLDCCNRGTSTLKYPNSMHNWGAAVDFCRNDGRDAYDDSDGFFTKVGRIGESIGLEWGGSWTSPVDKPHFQLAQWGSTVNRLKSIYGTPEKFRASWGAASSSNVGGNVSAGPVDNKVVEIQNYIKSKYYDMVGADGVYGPYTKAGLVRGLQTVLNNQTGAGLEVDGIFGAKTKAACINIQKGDKGELVYILQGGLYCSGYKDHAVDRDFGPYTEKSVKQFQSDKKIYVDGIAGKNTFAVLYGGEIVVNGVCTGNGVRVRSTPDLSSTTNILRSLNKGDTFTILGTAGDWTQINVAGLVGYVYSQYVAVV